MKYCHKKISYLFTFIFAIAIILVSTFLLIQPIFNSNLINNSNPITKTQNILQRNGRFSSGDSNTYIVFLKGLGTRCDGTRYNNMGFGYIRRKLTSYGFHYNDKKFLQYSYTGGEVKEGMWFPNKSKPEDTGQPIEISVKYLNDLIDEFLVVHPNARFILVGHSLGGLIAFNFISKYTENNWKIKGVVTLDAPLTGSIYNIPNIVLDILRDNGSIWGSIAVQQLISGHEFKEEIEESRKQVAQKLQKKGIHIATFATQQDLIVLPRSAYLIDINNKPITEGKIVSVSRMGKLPDSLFGHRQILEVDLIADYIVTILEA